MARRKKEEPIAHQKRIAETAIELFAKKGIENTKMDQIAEAAGYSKATLYVYFANKEDLVSFIAYESMEMLSQALSEAVSEDKSVEKVFMSICDSLVSFHTKYPAFFDRSLQTIQVETDEESWLGKAYQAGTRVNEIILQYFERGIREGVFPEFANPLETILHVWAMTSGLIKLAADKAEYFEKEGGFSAEQLLADGFKKIYRTLTTDFCD